MVDKPYLALMMYLYCNLQYKCIIFINVSLYICSLLIGNRGDSTLLRVADTELDLDQ